ncbi:TraR/DksA C4-type zinc finger protein [Streptomyces sp. XM4193]|uniref:TraR/DksA family transcriptional regulator n=1 Tax=Streptomyces sp. XM4193 TaxID=2929782 RepID=UPI001FF73963|nr:TraR/DksA C4-type zinc finger protein [Streptomyces sp. XM4193]MCK1796373.1 TraR/DksA C4-type zinc finger protein [Streptomyces sp. XM4193]
MTSGRSAARTTAEGGAEQEHRSAADDSTRDSGQVPNEADSSAPGRKTTQKAPAKKAAAEKTSAKKTTAKKTTAKKVEAKKAAAKKATAEKPPAKKTAAKKAAEKTPAKKPATKKTAKRATAERADAQQTGARTVAAKKTTTQKPSAVPQARGTTVAPGELAVRTGEDPWTAEEVEEARKELQDEAGLRRSEIAASEEALAGLMQNSGDGAGDDQADTGSKNITREHELALAGNAREMLYQIERALERMDAGTYGLCESCGKAIGKARMQAFPRATLCVECKQRQERR